MHSASSPLEPPSAPHQFTDGAGAPRPVDSQSAEINQILRALPPDEYAGIAARLDSVEIPFKTVLAEPDETWRYVYFPETMVASVINRLEGGGMIEVGTIGREGMVGLAAFLDADAAPSQTIAQVAGAARRLPASVFADGARDRPELQRLLHRYTHAYLTQVAQTAACNRMHEVERRCARWLLMTHDRVGGAPDFELTHEFLSFMLGVRRAGVSDAMGGLQDAGVIAYRRGHVRVLDRAALESASCECYGIVRRHFDRLLP